MPDTKKIEIEISVLDQVADWQAQSGVRSRGKAVAALVLEGLRLDAAERLGFSLADAMAAYNPAAVSEARRA